MEAGDGRDRDEDEPEFRPRIRSRRLRPPERVVPFLAQLEISIAKKGGRKRGPGRAASKVGRIAVRAPHDASRRCVIKAKYVAMKGEGSKIAKAHLAYLERDGVERDGSPGRLYGPDDSFDAGAFRQPLEGEPRQFRFIVSPEDADVLDLRAFARTLMKQVEKDTGRRLIWAAVNHHNTDNPHVHIVVRGLDRDGDEVRIDGRYIAREMRWRAQEVLTRELGHRLEPELTLARSLDIEDLRLTGLDRAIEALQESDGIVRLQRLLSDPGREGRACLARLRTLEGLRLAEVARPGVWRLAEGWTRSLQDLGDRQDVLERLRAFVHDQAIGYRVVDERNPCATVEGVVVGKGLDDELGGRMFVAVRVGPGEGVYLRLAPNVAESLREGDPVRVGFEVERWLKPADGIVARFAEENGGMYDPGRHRRALENLPRLRGETIEPTPEQRVAANTRRLERLERYQLVTRLPDGRWRIPPDLCNQLESRERTHPQHRMTVEKKAPELAHAKTREPVSVAQEISDLGRALASQLRLSHVQDAPAFMGRLLECVVAPSGREYARVVDLARGQFVLIPKPAEWDRFHGQTVRVARNREQQLVLGASLGLSR